MTLLDSSANPGAMGLRAKLVQEFRALAETHDARGPYLEVGVGPPENAILLDDHFGAAERHVIGAHESADIRGLAYRRGNPNQMRGLYKDGYFSTVFWNGALAQDKFFWRTLDEINRVLAPGGVLIVAAPAFSKGARFGVKVVGAKGAEIANATLTARAQTGSPDYWRVSPQAIKQIILDGFDVREVRIAFLIPRIFGVGVKHA